MRGRAEVVAYQIQVHSPGRSVCAHIRRPSREPELESEFVGVHTARVS